MYSLSATSDADTLQELTNKVAIFSTEQFVITIHREPVAFIDQLQKANSIDPVNAEGLFTCEPDCPFGPIPLMPQPTNWENRSIIMRTLFFLKEKPSDSQGHVFFKAQGRPDPQDANLSRDIVEHIDDPTENNPSTRGYQRLVRSAANGL